MWLGVAIAAALLVFCVVVVVNPWGVMHGESNERMESDREHYPDPD